VRRPRSAKTDDQRIEKKEPLATLPSDQRLVEVNADAAGAHTL
jgi:hypothetical protein